MPELGAIWGGSSRCSNFQFMALALAPAPALAVGLALVVRIREAYGTIEDDGLNAADYNRETGGSE